MDDRPTPLPSRPATSAAGTDRRVRGLRVGTVLLLVALIPLAGVGWSTWRSIDEARAVARAATSTERAAQATAALVEFDAAVFDEMVWAAMMSVIRTIDAPTELITTFLGSDPTADFAEVVARTDQLATAAGQLDALDALAVARATDIDLREMVVRYQAVIDPIRATLEAQLDDLATSRPGASGARLRDTVDLLEVAVRTRGAISQQFTASFAVRFDVRGAPADELRRLIGLRDDIERGLATLATAESTRLPDVLDAIAAEPNLASFSTSVEALVADGLSQGVPTVGAPVSLESIVGDVQGFVTVYRAATESTDLTVSLLDATVADVLDATADMGTDADEAIRAAYERSTLLTLASLLTALLAARFIVVPLRALRRSTHDLQNNQESSAVAVQGPVEVKAAAIAIRDASAHIDLVTQQARALAIGDLDADVLDATAPGGLGLALQHAVGTLRAALSQQDEFRRRLAHEASHDGLTKLPNRSASMAQLTRSLARTTRSGAELAVLFVDLDHFKDVNDHHGHHAGDTVLTTIAQRLVNHVREGDHVGRLGGDEFVVIAEPVGGIDDAVELARRIVAALTEPIELTGVRVTVGASIGIALASQSDLTADELLRDADLAVYRAKEVGRGGIEICDEDLRKQMAETADLSLAIRRAIDHDELVVHYQPIIDVDTGDLHALEALVRWARPGEQGLVPPDTFIGFAERSALIIDLDRWVIESVARQVATWRRDPGFADTPVAINVSGRHLAHDRFVDHVLEPLERHGVPPETIIVEITESALLEDLAAAAVKLQRLRDRGILVSIDDFGTGYTSLAHLRSLPVDILKIDRSFTANAATNPHEASIVKLIIDTGHLLGATITAEGVETAHEADRLSGLGSDNLQGFYFARPQPPEHLVFDTPMRTGAEGTHSD
ncbi:MAG: EAL domain-containing protein [Acidimicrobiales bacterium]|nr:EAL domain-containing protein [Acidimicrobiales bacterium]MCB9393445.1 EAL domain-containing protein [Acidimicrobiaceae bacterium]